MEPVERVVVGVDGSECARLALRFAHEEATLRGVPLVPVMAWSYLDQHHLGGGSEFRPDYTTDHASAALQEIVGEELGTQSTASVQPVVVNDLAPAALLGEATSRDLLVVGSRGRGGFRGMLLGSVSQHVVHHAPCPVIIVRAEPDGD